jgi:hypothetical protein
MDLGSMFAYNSVIVDPLFVDSTPCSATSDDSVIEGLSEAPHQIGLYPTDADTMSKLGVCSSCRKYVSVSNYERGLGH